jgi:hypothetical protein
MTTAHDTDVLFLDDLCARLRVSRRVVERLRRHGAFPIPELPALDKRPRWSRQAVERYLAGSGELVPRLSWRKRA